MGQSLETLAKKETETAKLQQNVVTLKAELDAMKKNNTNNITVVKENMKRQLQAKDEQIQKLVDRQNQYIEASKNPEKIRNISQQINAQMKAMEAIQTSLFKKEKQLDKNKAEIDNLKLKNEQLNVQILSLTADISIAKQSEKLKRNNEILKNELEALTNHFTLQNQSLKTEIQILTSDKKDRDDSIKVLKDENSNILSIFKETQERNSKEMNEYMSKMLDDYLKLKSLLEDDSYISPLTSAAVGGSSGGDLNSQNNQQNVINGVAREDYDKIKHELELLKIDDLSKADEIKTLRSRLELQGIYIYSNLPLFLSILILYFLFYIYIINFIIIIIIETEYQTEKYQREKIFEQRTKAYESQIESFSKQLTSTDVEDRLRQQLTELDQKNQQLSEELLTKKREISNIQSNMKDITKEKQELIQSHKKEMNNLAKSHLEEVNALNEELKALTNVAGRVYLYFLSLFIE